MYSPSSIIAYHPEKLRHSLLLNTAIGNKSSQLKTNQVMPEGKKC